MRARDGGGAVVHKFALVLIRARVERMQHVVNDGA